MWFFSTKGGRNLFDAQLSRGDALVFGRETAGLPDEVLQESPDRVLRLPMVRGERSLNLATAVCAVVYEGVRQVVARGEAAVDGTGNLVI